MKNDFRYDSDYIGKWVELLPMSREARKWAKANGTEVRLLKWQAEYCTVRAKNRKQKTFGPHDASWMLFR